MGLGGPLLVRGGLPRFGALPAGQRKAGPATRGGMTPLSVLQGQAVLLGAAPAPHPLPECPLLPGPGVPLCSKRHPPAIPASTSFPRDLNALIF